MTCILQLSNHILNVYRCGDSGHSLLQLNISDEKFCDPYSANYRIFNLPGVQEFMIQYTIFENGWDQEIRHVCLKLSNDDDEIQGFEFKQLPELILSDAWPQIHFQHPTKLNHFIALDYLVILNVNNNNNNAKHTWQVTKLSIPEVFPSKCDIFFPPNDYTLHDLLFEGCVNWNAVLYELDREVWFQGKKIIASPNGLYTIARIHSDWILSWNGELMNIKTSEKIKLLPNGQLSSLNVTVWNENIYFLENDNDDNDDRRSKKSTIHKISISFDGSFIKHTILLPAKGVFIEECTQEEVIIFCENIGWQLIDFDQKCCQSLNRLLKPAPNQILLMNNSGKQQKLKKSLEACFSLPGVLFPIVLNYIFK